MRYWRNNNMAYFEVYHVWPCDPIAFERICEQWLKSLKEQENSWVINLAETIRRRCIYWLDQRTQELRIGSLYFRPERPSNSCNYFAVKVSWESIILNNKLEFSWFENYWGSRTTLTEFLWRNTSWVEYSAEIVIPNAPIIRNFSYINRL